MPSKGVTTHMPKEGENASLPGPRRGGRLNGSVLGAGYPRRMPQMPKRHTNAVFLGDLRGQNRGSNYPSRTHC